MHRFFAPALPDPGELVDLPTEAVHQCSRVLRLKPGEEVALLDGSGREAIVRLTDVSARTVRGVVTVCTTPSREPLHSLQLVVSMPRQEKWEWILQKAVELGVDHFQPLETARSVVHLSESDRARKTARWEKIIVEAVEQSGRTRIPSIAAPQNLKEFVRLAAPGILLHTDPSLTGLRHVLSRLPSGDPRWRSVLVGPEGGLTSSEIAALLAAGWAAASLGVRTLRCETAAIVACSLILDAAGDLGSSAP